MCSGRSSGGCRGISANIRVTFELVEKVSRAGSLLLHYCPCALENWKDSKCRRRRRRIRFCCVDEKSCTLCRHDDYLVCFIEGTPHCGVCLIGCGGTCTSFEYIGNFRCCQTECDESFCMNREQIETNSNWKHCFPYTILNAWVLFWYLKIVRDFDQSEYLCTIRMVMIRQSNLVQCYLKCRRILWICLHRIKKTRFCGLGKKHLQIPDCIFSV